MVDQKIIDEATARGIVPGARISDWQSVEATVPATSEWYIYSSALRCYNEGQRIVDIKSNTGRWATVITPAPQAATEGLVDDDSCECGPAMRAAIIELARELGLDYNETDPNRADMTGIRTDVHSYGPRIIPNAYSEQKYNLTPEAFISKMRVTAAKPKPIRIGDHEVKFNAGSIKVRCTTIDNATIRAIAANLKD